MRRHVLVALFVWAVLLHGSGNAQMSQEQEVRKKLLGMAAEEAIKDAKDKGSISQEDADKLLNAVKEEQEKAEKRYKELTQKKSPGEVEWKEFVSKEGGFSVLFPGTPTVKHMASESGMISHEFLAPTVNNEIAFTLQYYEIPKNADPKKVAEFLNIFRDQFLRAGALRSEKRISLGGTPGKELIIDFTRIAASSQVRLYQTKKCIYCLMCMISPSGAEFPKVAGKFFDSFKLGQYQASSSTRSPETATAAVATKPAENEAEIGTTNVNVPSKSEAAGTGIGTSSDSEKAIKELREQRDQLDKRLKELEAKPSSGELPSK